MNKITVTIESVEKLELSDVIARLYALSSDSPRTFNVQKVDLEKIKRAEYEQGKKEEAQRMYEKGLICVSRACELREA